MTDEERLPTIRVVKGADVDDLIRLMRAYCDFYDADPSDAALRELSKTLISDPEHEGLQLIARNPQGEAIGFATVYWTWSTTHAARIGVMNDLFVAPHARSAGVARFLIYACRDRCRAHGVSLLTWQTAPHNLRAQRLYDRLHATREEWIEYSLDV
jgi:GNAT superfamily N-acetyltransferase